MNLELREKIAMRVMGWERGDSKAGESPWLSPVREGDNRNQRKYRGMWTEHRLPAYELNIADAWLVVEEMRKRGFWLVEISQCDDWCCIFEHSAGMWCVDRTAHTAPLAICKAALAAIESETP